MNSKITVPQSLASDTDHTYEAYPRLRELARAQAMDTEDIKTTYEKLDDRTERVTWTNPKGEGFTWVQTWPCPLSEAPQIGDLYRTLHDEWFLPAGGEGETRRVIHTFESCPAKDEA